MRDRQFVTFSLGEDLFGIDILLVREINRNLDITQVDLSPDFMSGLLNLRGQIVTVLDLGVRLGLGPRTVSRGSRCIILKTSQELSRSHSSRNQLDDSTSVDLVGLLVDSIGDIVTVPENRIQSAPSRAGGVSQRFLAGVVRLEKQLLVTLRMSEVLSLEDVRGHSLAAR